MDLTRALAGATWQAIPHLAFDGEILEAAGSPEEGEEIEIGGLGAALKVPESHFFPLMKGLGEGIGERFANSWVNISQNFINS